MSEYVLLPCPFCGGDGQLTDSLSENDEWVVWCPSCRSSAGLYYMPAAAIAAWNRRVTTGAWQPVKFDDPNNDGSVWVDENGCVCWAGANGETRRLVLDGDMRLCLWVEATP
jgi:Lar family restriction alleviation protein